MSTGLVADSTAGEIVIVDKHRGSADLRERLALRLSARKARLATREWRMTLHGALWVGGLDLGLVLLMLTSWEVPILWNNLRYGVSILAVSGIGVITFLGILVLSHRSGHPGFSTGEMRSAMAAAFMVVYFTMLGILMFFYGKLPEMAPTLIKNFTYLVGVVIAFYFGSTAAVELATEKYRHTSDRDSPTADPQTNSELLKGTEVAGYSNPAGPAQTPSGESSIQHSPW
jgi:hypothetical protein